jgi:glycosyltransferase involved in cell wall biosynthesis
MHPAAERPNESPLDVSVVVPTCRRPGPLARALEALCAQTHPKEAFEVIVVDNADGADAVAAPFAARLPLRLVTEARRGPAAARNAGARVARAAHLAFLDDDCRPEPGWVAALADALRARPDALIGGSTLEQDDGWCTSAGRLILDHFCAAQSENEQPRFFPSNNVALPTAAFAALGGFDTSFPEAAGEDRDFCARWHEAGRPFAVAAGAVVHHEHPLGLLPLLRQQMRYGRGARRFRTAARGRGFPPISFYLGLLARPFRTAGLRRGAGLAVLVGAAQAAVVAGYVSERLGDSVGLKALRTGS